MNIGIFDATPAWSGGANECYLMGSEMRRRGHNVSFVCLRGSMLSMKAFADGFTVKIITPRYDPDLFSMFRIVRFIVLQKIDILDLRSPKFYWIGSFAGRLCRRKVIITRNVPFRKNVLKRHINSMLYNILADGVIAVSGLVYSSMRKDFNIPENKIRSISHGINPLEYPYNYSSGKIREEFGLHDFILAAVISRLDNSKGLEYFIDAIPPVVKKEKNIRFLVVGEGNLRMN